MLHIHSKLLSRLALLTALVLGCNSLNTSNRDTGKPGSGGEEVKDNERFGDSTVQISTYPVPLNGANLVDARNFAGLNGRILPNGDVLFTPLTKGKDGKLTLSKELATNSKAEFNRSAHSRPHA